MSDETNATTRKMIDPEEVDERGEDRWDVLLSSIFELTLHYEVDRRQVAAVIGEVFDFLKDCAVEEMTSRLDEASGPGLAPDGVLDRDEVDAMTYAVLEGLVFHESLTRPSSGASGWIAGAGARDLVRDEMKGSELSGRNV